MKSMLALALLGFVSFAGAANAACNVQSPISLFGADGKGNGIINNDGSNNLTPDSLAGQIIGPNNDGQGVATVNGTADCSAAFKELQDEIDQGAALAAAMSAPVWLGDSESFRVSGGVGFTDGEAAVGATGLARINRNVAGYAGAAVSTSNSDAWSAKAGVSVGW